MSEARGWLGRGRVPALLMLLTFAVHAFGANVIATVDRNQVGVNESFRLTFEADGVVGAPDFSVLDQNFEVLDKSQNQSVSIINGQTSRKFEWELVLMAAKEGVFQIPPISFGGALSQPISVVVKAGSDTREANKSLYLEVEVDVEQPYVQQQVVFTVRLFRSVEIASATLSELAVEGVDALIEPFGEDKSYQMVRNGRRWLVVERKYLVFPQQSGYLTIRPIEFRGQVVDRRSSLGLFSQPSGSPVVLRSESVTIAVREPPASFAGPWLPAKRLQLEEAWPEGQEITVGEPVTRSITISAVGLTGAQLPEINPQLPSGLRAYPEQAALEDSGVEEGVLGSRVQSMAIIPTREGPITFPEVRVAWWNVAAGQPEIATIPSRTIAVNAAAVTPEAAVAESADVPEVAVAELGEDVTGPIMRDWWPWTSLFLALAWLITLVLWALDRKRRRVRPAPPIVARTAADPGPALAEAVQACKMSNALQAKDALLKWGAATWPEAPPGNLGHLAACCGEPLATGIAGLEQHLYGNGKDWKPEEVGKQLRDFKRTDKGDPHGTALSLEPMYRA